MKGLIHTIKSSFYDPAFYQQVRTKTVSSSFKLFAVLGALGIGVSMLLALPFLSSFASTDVLTKVENAYPDDLVVRIAGGKMQVNQEQPYYVPNTLFDASTTKYLIIFDGTNQLAPDLKANSTFALMKEDALITEGQNDQQQIVPLSQFGTTTIDKSKVVGMVEKARPYFIPAVYGAFAILLLLLVSFGTVLWMLFHFLYTLIPALIVFLYAKVRGSSLTYHESYMTALYATVPVAIAFWLVFHLLLALPAPPYTYTLLVLIVVIANLAGEKQE